MKEAFSLWQQGRDPGSGRITSMTPHTCSTDESLYLGTISIGLQALEVIGTFGIWYELHKKNVIDSAQFEERRHAWLNDVLDQWIAEHQHTPCIKVDTTKHLIKETDKILDKLKEEEKFDVPQVLLLKCSRIAEYFDELSLMWASILNNIVVESKSDRAWIVPFKESDAQVKEWISKLHSENAKDNSGRWLAALGISSLLFPFISPIIGGGLIGAGIRNEFKKHSNEKKITHIEDYPDLLKLILAGEQLLAIFNIVEEFMARQEFNTGTILYAVPKTDKSELYLGPDKAVPWYKFIFKKSVTPKLKMLPAPAPDKH
jgi:hypothetical protein